MHYYTIMSKFKFSLTNFVKHLTNQLRMYLGFMYWYITQGVLIKMIILMSWNMLSNHVWLYNTIIYL